MSQPNSTASGADHVHTPARVRLRQFVDQMPAVPVPTEEPGAGQVRLFEAFVAMARHSPLRALDALPEVLDDKLFVAAVTSAAAARGLRREDVLPETAGRDLAARGGWVRVLDVDNLNRYGTQVGFQVIPGSVFYAVPDHADAMHLDVVAPYAERPTLARDAAHTFSLPLRLARIETPPGPMMLYPREYARLDSAGLAEIAESSCFTPLDESDTGVDAEQVFMLRSRGISRANALGMLAPRIRTSRLGWFTPHTPPVSDGTGLRLDAMSWPLSGMRV